MTTLHGRYELTHKIGSGGMGTVWRARDTVLDRDVAVKLMHEGQIADGSERFAREARAAARLSHTNIAAVYDSGTADGSPYIVMELVDGESLHRRIHRRGALPVAETVEVIRAVLAALSHAHGNGLVHRDMKPANVLIDAEGLVKVVDFGIAKGLDDSAGGITRTGSLIGTASYLSPEQVHGQDATPRSDLYAVGCLMYTCLTGGPPFEGGSPVAVAMQHTNAPVPSLRARRPDVPVALEQVVMRALEKDPARRFASAPEMIAALTAIDARALPTEAATVMMPAAIPESTEVIAAVPRRASTVSRLLGAAAAVLIAGAALWFVASALTERSSDTFNAPLSTPPPPTATPPPTQAPVTVQTARPPALDLPGIGPLEFPDDPTPSPTPATPSPSPTATASPGPTVFP